MRQCNECGETLPLTHFHKNGTDKDGRTRYRADCRTCYNIKRKMSKKRFNKFKNKPKHRTNAGKIPNYTMDEWKTTLIYWKGECAYCGRHAGHGKHLTKDHVKPIVDGGKTNISNIVPACERCNFSKGSKEMIEWYKVQKYFSKKKLDKILRWCK